MGCYLQAYDLWSRHYRSTYPSTLYVTLERISTALPQETVPEPSARSFDPLQEEKGTLTFEQMVQLQIASKRYVLEFYPDPTHKQKW